MKASPEPRRAWPRLKNCKNKQEREIIIKFLELKEVLQRRRYRKLIRNLHSSGILINSKMRRRRKQQRRSSWILQLLKKFSPMRITAPNMMLVKILLIQKEMEEIILSDKAASISLEAIPLVVDPSNLNFISTEDLMAFTQFVIITILLLTFFYIKSNFVIEITPNYQLNHWAVCISQDIQHTEVGC